MFRWASAPAQTSVAITAFLLLQDSVVQPELLFMKSSHSRSFPFRYFRSLKKSSLSSMKLGKRNCERRRQSVWRGGYHQPTVPFLFVSVTHGPEIWPPSLPPPPPSVCVFLVGVCDNRSLLPQPNSLKRRLSFSLFFNPSWAVLSHLFHLPFSFPLHSFCLFPLSSQRVTLGWTPTPIWHIFSPSRSLVCCADDSRVTVCPLSVIGASHCCHTTC